MSLDFWQCEADVRSALNESSVIWHFVRGNGFEMPYQAAHVEINIELVERSHL